MLFSEGRTKMWLWGVNFSRWGDEQILRLWRGSPSHPPSRENRAVCIWKTLSVPHALGIEDFMQNLFPFFDISSCDLYYEAFIIELF